MNEYTRELRGPAELIQERECFEKLQLTSEQAVLFDAVRASIDGKSEDHLFYVDGPAGTGKTFVYRKLLHYVRMTGRIALAVAMSAVAISTVTMSPLGMFAFAPVCPCSAAAQLFRMPALCSRSICLAFVLHMLILSPLFVPHKLILSPLFVVIHRMYLSGAAALVPGSKAPDSASPRLVQLVRSRCQHAYSVTAH